MRRAQELLTSEFGNRIQTDVKLSKHTTFGIGGPAEMYFAVHVPEEIFKALTICKSRSIPVTVLGGGSNVLAPDEGIPGLVLKIYTEDSIPEIKNHVIHVKAALSDKSYAEFTGEAGVSGFENLYDIPGTIGGAIMQNAAMTDFEISSHLIDATFIDKNCDVVTLPKEKLNFEYRHSYFKEKQGVILSARFKIPQKKTREDIFKEMENIKSARWSKFPMEYPNCGSVFKRPKGDYAGRLIMEANLGGYRIGDAMVSDKHRNFIVNMGGAKAEDVKKLVEYVRKTILNKYGIELERELIYL